jgi:hypothetical protein
VPQSDAAPAPAARQQRGARAARRETLTPWCHAPRHHAAILLYHHYLGRSLGGWPRSPPRLAPPGGRITISRGPRCPAVPGGSAPQMSLPTPLARDVGDQCLRAHAATSSCCGLAAAVVTHDGSPASTALAAVHDTLSERRPVVANVVNLSALTGARAGAVGVTLTTKEGKGSAIAPQNRRCAGRDATHLNLENSHFLFLKGWGYLRRTRWRLCGACWHLL